MTNNRDIQENGKIICEFLELSIRDKRAKSNPVYYIPFSTISCLEYWPDGGDPSISQDTDIRASETLFHSDWNWIMVVVEKIESTHNYQDFEIVGNRAKLNSYSALNDCFDDFFDGETKLEATYKAAVEFIKWYNLNKI